jgi:hypothetical protein
MYPERKKYGRNSRKQIPASIASGSPLEIRSSALRYPPGNASPSYRAWNSAQARSHSRGAAPIRECASAGEQFPLRFREFVLLFGFGPCSQFESTQPRGPLSRDGYAESMR